MAGPVDHLDIVGEVVEKLRGSASNQCWSGAWPWWYWDHVA
jgi:hypothetical protein